jgi:hypothetical protein
VLTLEEAKAQFREAWSKVREATEQKDLQLQATRMAGMQLGCVTSALLPFLLDQRRRTSS